MKASETFERYDGKVRECCNYAVRSSKSFMENADTNKRQADGKAELVLRDQLTKDLKEFCDEVDEVSFYAKQKAYITSNLLTFIFLVATAVFAILFSLVNPYFILAALVTALLSLLAALGVFGGTSKSVEDINVFARRKASGEPAARIIFEANLDAPFKRNISRGTAALLKILTLLGVALYIAFCVVMLLVDNGTLNFGFQDELEYLAYGLPIFVIFPLILSRTVSTGSSFPGVADNLLGAYAACGAMRYMSEQDLRLESTELCVLLTSSKEAKNAGAKAFVRDFKADLDALDTTILCFDSIYDPDSLNVVSKGRKVSKLVDEAAANAGVLLTDHNPKYHKGDLKVYDKAGLAAAQISSLPDEVPPFYRNENDDVDLLNPNAVHAVEGAIKVALEAAYALDA
ncbi:MAG: M28 family peptidase, partial [Clostridia bacterium]|nr:M28 family peptidase [Clostridia bacterium]